MDGRREKDAVAVPPIGVRTGPDGTRLGPVVPEILFAVVFGRMLCHEFGLEMIESMERLLMRITSGVWAALALTVFCGLGARDGAAQTKDLGWPNYGNDAG